MKYKILILSILSVLLYSCRIYDLETGNRYYESENYAKAVEHWEKAPSKNVAINIKLGVAYLKLRQYDKADQLFQKIIETDVNPQLYLSEGLALIAQEKYNEASIILTNYIEQNPDDKFAQAQLATCAQCLRPYSDTTRYFITPVEFEELTASFSCAIKGKTLAFCASPRAPLKETDGRTGEKYLNIYQADTIIGHIMKEPQILPGNINGIYHDGPFCFSKNGTGMLITRNNYNDRKIFKNNKNESTLKIIEAQLEEGKYLTQKEFRYNNPEYSVGHPWLIKDDSILIFVSDMPGGLGGTDLYMCRKDGNGDWGIPENLGAGINTPGNEMFPTYFDDTLYFSSDGIPGKGGLDLFKTPYPFNQAPERLPIPFNSNRDDFSFIKNKPGTGYFSSDREGNDRLYHYKVKPKQYVIKGIVPLGTKLILTDLDRKIQIRRSISDLDSSFSFTLKENSHYQLLATKEMHFSKSIDIDTRSNEPDTILVNVSLEKIEIEKPIVLDNIYYDLNKWDIRPDAASELQKFAKVLNENPEITVELSSHTDSRADDKYNLILSEKRAKSAVEYLIALGIDPQRIKHKGYGETMLVNACGNNVDCPEEDHQRNRRTEFKVTKYVKTQQ